MMNLLPDLTIIIPNYNTRTLLKQCLDSIYTYTRGITFEVICIDELPKEAVRKRISRIGVYDNATGMSPASLRKALQFGNGSRAWKQLHDDY